MTTTTEMLSQCIARINVQCTARKVRGPIACRRCRGTGNAKPGSWQKCPDCKGVSVRAPRDGDDWKDGANHWEVTLSLGGRILTVPYWTGVGIKEAPNAQDVVGSMLSDATCADGTFADFCDNMGMDTDSRKALATYEACQQSGADLRTLVGGEHYRALLNAENDR